MRRLGNSRLVRVFAKHDPYWDTGHLGDVVEEMKTLGTPIINVVEWRGDYYATEGSHRLWAAHNLELVPNFNVSYPDYYDPSDESFLEIAKLRLPHYTWAI
jgi:hypothetical protein